MLSVGADPVVVERQLCSGGLGCPQCGGRLAPWGYAAPRFVRRAAAVVARIRPRRAICSSAAGCGRSHVLLPRLCLGRRVDPVAVIWAALLARASGWGWRRICAAAGRPASTVRGWLSRFAEHAEPIRVGFARLEHLANTGADMARLEPTASPLADAVSQIGVACAAVRRMAGSVVFKVSAAELVAACSGGWLLGMRPPTVAVLPINTSSHL
ncbi:helix-turn-helix domain-containing protein [Mycobacterium helveticum]|uniref:Helix-turn-helix domain-containing protein n=1 Tax=Mycobacterium helveticum TaxID=2592811 RepID=A0A557WMR3_9MYCO|nr:helix-turn-helix domain-containing protein [Mycobacterium helveticum]